MDITIIYLILVLTGLCFGSFAGATMWRLRAGQLETDKKFNNKHESEELAKLHKLTGSGVMHDRSKCLNCSYVLRWYDLLPIVSWVMLSGKCRKCHKPIGYLEPLIEIGVMVFFVLSFMFWPYQLDNALQICRFVIWLVAVVGLAVLFSYDVKWYILPDKISFSVIGLGLISSIISIILSQNKLETVLSIFGAVCILSGIYLVLYLLSKGKWIGFGDVKLGLGLALILADWKLAFVAIFAANLIGCLIVLPFLISGKLKRNSHVPFGPLLIVGFAVAGLAGIYLVNLYLSVLL